MAGDDVRECVFAQHLSGEHIGRVVELTSETGGRYHGKLEDIQHSTALEDTVQVSIDDDASWYIVLVPKSAYVRFVE